MSEMALVHVVSYGWLQMRNSSPHNGAEGSEPKKVSSLSTLLSAIGKGFSKGNKNSASFQHFIHMCRIATHAFL